MKIAPRTVLMTVGIALLVIFSGCGDGAAGSAGQGKSEASQASETQSAITLDAAAITAAGIQTATAAVLTLRRVITAPGQLEFNARRLVHLTARTPGRVERILAFAGDRVHAGQILAEVFSPDCMALQSEYLQAAERARRLGDDPSETGTARDFLESVRARLVLVGFSSSEVEDLETKRIPHPLLRIRAPFAATIVETGVVAGDHVELGASLFRLADLSVLWANLHVKEKDLASVTAGSGAELRTQAFPGEIFRGERLMIGGVVDEKTRTVIARVEVPNPQARLKAGMYIEAALDGGGARPALAVPESAVQDDEGRHIVFVETGRGIYRRREVEPGERRSGLVEIRRGLAAGETVVTSGSFLLKSEMRKGSLEDEHGHS